MIVQNVPNILTGLTRKLRRLPILMASALLLVGLSACDDQNEPSGPSGPKLPEGRTYLSVVVTSDSPSGRAGEWGGPTWGDSYNNEDGNAFEKKIRQDRVHVAILKADGTPVGYNQDGVPKGNYYTGDVDDDIMILPMPGNENTFYAYVDVTDLNLRKGTEYILAVTANYTNSSVPAINSISNTTFPLDSLAIHNEGETIDPTEYYNGALPMFGVMRWKFGELEAKDGYFDTSTIGTVRMLRSVCKIEVLLPTEKQSNIAPYLEFNDEIKPHLFLINGRRHINKSGFITPKKDNWLLPSIKQTTDISFINSFNERPDRWTSGNADDPHLYLPATIRDKNNKTIGYYVYLPEASGESMNPFEDALRLNVSVKYNAPVPDGDGSEDEPYNVPQVLDLEDLEDTEAWVEGYIIGYYNTANSALVTTAEGANASNVVIAADPKETDINNAVIIQLPTGDIRSKVNLADNPKNLGRKMAFNGLQKAYLGHYGVINVVAYLDKTRIVTGTLFPSIPYDEEKQCYPEGVDYNAWKLYRNHIYRFTIKAIGNETSLEYNVSATGSTIIDVPTFE